MKNEKFLTDRDVVGECPYCHKQAYGNQCEEGCGRALEPTELINPRSKETGEAPVLKETKNWYLPLNEYQEWLKEWILENHKEWRPNVYGQCKSWLDMDLQPRAMTRDLDWGIPVPVEGAEGKVFGCKGSNNNTGIFMMGKDRIKGSAECTFRRRISWPLCIGAVTHQGQYTLFTQFGKSL